jgi:hypothetical protein
MTAIIAQQTVEQAEQEQAHRTLTLVAQAQHVPLYLEEHVLEDQADQAKQTS